MCFVLPQKNTTFSQKKKKNIFLRKHDFSRKLEGGTGLQGGGSILNLYHIFLNGERVL